MPGNRSNHPALRVALGGIAGVATVAYPVLVFWALRTHTPRVVSSVLMVGMGPAVWAMFRSAKRRTSDRTAALRSTARGFQNRWLVLAAGVLLALAATLNSLQPLLLVPVAINGFLLFTFGHTLWLGTPLIERFARLQHSDLTTPEVSWCRLWTVIWSTFFLLNIGVAAVLAGLNRVAWWTVYNGLVTYCVMGLLFGSEYALRKYRFGRLQQHPLDQLLRWVFARVGRLDPHALADRGGGRPPERVRRD